MNKLTRSLAVIGTSATMMLGVAAAPSQASTDVTSYSYHYDNVCQMNIRYAGEPFTPGYIVQWWYKDYKTVRYFTLAEQLAGYPATKLLRTWTVFSHRSYPKAIRCWSAYG